MYGDIIRALESIRNTTKKQTKEDAEADGKIMNVNKKLTNQVSK